MNFGRYSASLNFPIPSNPVYLVEDVEDFNFHTSESLAEFLNGICRAPDDGCYFNVYRIAGDWRSPRLGTDPHVHVENRQLDRVRTGGVDALW